MREITNKGITVMEPDGDITFMNSSKLKEEVNELIAAQKVKIIVDLAQIKYLDSSGVGVFVSCQYDLKKAGGDIKFINADEKVKEVFQFTNLDQLLRVYDSEEEAVNSL